MCIKTFNEFIEWAAQFKVEQHLFRGVSNECYKIEPSACRRLPKSNRYNPSKLLKINQELIEKARELGHDQKNGKHLSDLELLAELQHFGAATCLMDFSRNALVALWFACQTSSDGEANGKVFAVNRDDTVRLKMVTPKSLTKEIDCFLMPNEKGEYLIYQWQPKLQNNRIIAQKSVFLFSGDKIEEDAKCVIDKNSKQDILISLEQISDITEGSIYPDFDGFARQHAHNKPYIEPDIVGHLLRGIYAHQNSNMDDAIEYYTQIIRSDPEDVSVVAVTYNHRGNAYLEKGVIEFAIGDYSRAIEEYNRILKLNPDDYTTYENLAEAYYQRGIAHNNDNNDDLAIMDYTQAIEMHPNYIEALSNRGEVYNRKGEYEKSVQDFEHVIHWEPDNPHGYFNRGNVYHKIRNYENAIQDFTNAIDLKSDFVAAYRNRGLTYMEKGDYEHGIADQNKAIALEPENANAYFNLGVIYTEKEDFDFAIENFTKAIELYPDFAGAYNHRGVVFRDKQSDYESAIEDFTKAMELKPDFIDEVYNNRGIAYRKKDDYERAIEDHNEAIRLERENAHNPGSYHYNRSVVWLIQQEWEKTRKDFITAEEKQKDVVRNEFCNNKDYDSVADFEQKHNIKLPEDIAAMLTPP